MRHIRISRHHGARHTVAAAFWVVAGVVAVIAFGDILTLLAVALAMVTTAWWISRGVGLRPERVERNDARRYATGVGSRAFH
jgi:predicted signal transduction protein with EAL and GGDEF domain